jgi:geranylgeranyl diphosphate synthase type I
MDLEYVEARRDAIDERLADVLADVEPAELAAWNSEAVLAGGKRVRPTLTLLVCEGVGGDTDRALEFAAGIELVHTASLVVDDIIDRSAVRRGTDSTWAAHGHGPALVTSDGLLGEAFALFSADPRATEVVAEAMVELGQGEATELAERPTTEAAYMQLAQRKTGALFRAAAELGAVAADADDATVAGAGEYAERVGVAFQMRDDVLDATADAGELGKPTGKDAEMDRPSILQVTDRSPEEVTALARDQSREALAALDELALSGAAAGHLEELARFVVERER